MIIYNVTVKIDHDVHDDWFRWMKNVHIPEVMATGCFVDQRILHLISVDTTDGHSYAIQYKVKDMATLDHYQNTFAKALQEDHTTRYKDKFVAFRTLMEEV